MFRLVHLHVLFWKRNKNVDTEVKSAENQGKSQNYLSWHILKYCEIQFSE